MLFIGTILTSNGRLNFQCSLSVCKAAFSRGYSLSVELWTSPDWRLSAPNVNDLISWGLSSKSGIVFDEIRCQGRDTSDIPRRRL